MGFDKNLEGGSTVSVSSPFADSVITSREGQSAYHSIRQSSGGPKDFHIAESPSRASDDKTSNGMVQDLVYRTTVDPIREQCGALLANFDSITSKMSKMFNDPLIKNADGFTGQEVSDVVNDQGKMAKFSRAEQKTLTVLNDNSDRAFGDAATRLTRQAVVNFAEQIGILKRT